MNGMSSNLMIPFVEQAAYKIARWLRSFALTMSLPKGSARFTKQGYVQWLRSINLTLNFPTRFLAFSYLVTVNESRRCLFIQLN